MKTITLTSLLLLLICCFTDAGARAQGLPAGRSPQSPWSIPGDDMSSGSGIRSDTPQFESPTGIVSATLLDYKEKCLPLPDNFDAALSGSAYRAGTYSQAAGIIKSAPNPCEASVELKLFLEGQKGEWTMGSYAAEGKDMGLRVVISAIFQKYILGMAVNPTLTIGIKLSSLVDEELKKRSAAAPIQEAKELFTKTRGMTKEGVDQTEAALKAQVAEHEKTLDRLTVKYGQQLESYRPSHPYNRLNPSTAWQTFFDRELELAKQEAAERADILYKVASLEFQRGVLNQYRRPLLEKTCEQMMAELGPDCPQKKKTVESPKPPEPPKISDSLLQTDKNALNGCLCRCTINPTIGVGATFDPKPWKNASPSCDDARYGPCVGFGLGCWRQHMLSDGECFDSCVANAHAKPQEVKTEIYQTKVKAYNDFLGEARSIIEEYLSYKAGLYRKKAGRGINSDFILLAGNFPDDASLGQVLFAAASPGTALSTYAEMVKEKNRRGDPDRALGLVRSAEAVMPERKASGETTNILAEFAIMMSKASLNIVTELQFDEGLYLLRKAAEFYASGKANSLGENIQRLTGNFEKWKEDWQVLKSEIPACLAHIRDKRVCECDRLHSKEISPAANSLTIYESASSEKWTIGTANGTPRAIPEKDRIYNDLKDRLARAKNECANNPVMNTKEMRDLTDYETRKTLEKSPYINQEDLNKYSAPVICDTRAVKYADKLLSGTGLCDCQQEKIKGILDMAKKDERPLVIEFDADKKELSVGERVMLNLSIKGGKPPFSADLIGDYSYDMHSEARGFNINYQAQKPGMNNFYVTVVDACGDSGSRKVFVNVKPARKTAETKKTKEEPKLTVSLRADKTRLKVNERTYVHINVQNHRPPYTLTWGGYAQGLGDQGGKVPFVGAPSPGTYTVTADVTDAGGRRAAGSITLTVTGETVSKPPAKTAKSDVSGAPAPPVYDPTKDPGAGGSGSKNIDIAQVDKFGSDFRDGSKGPKQSDPKIDKPQAPVQQPDTYTGSATKDTDSISSDHGVYTQPPYIYEGTGDRSKDWTGSTRSNGDRGYGSNTGGGTSPPKARCDAAQKQAAYQAGVTCGQKARQKRGSMTTECITASQGYMNTDNRMGWGSCLYSGFDEGYRTGLGTTSGDASGGVMAELENRSGENIHIFAEGQENFSPQNKLAPGGKRKVSVKVPKGGGFVKFLAGRNGQKLAECRWEYTPGSSARVPVVKFSDPGSLTCVTGLR